MNGNPNPAYTQYFNSLPAQAFFETSLGSTGYCAGSYAGISFSSCTSTMAFNELTNLTTQSVWSLWSDLDNGGCHFPPPPVKHLLQPTTGHRTEHGSATAHPAS